VTILSHASGFWRRPKKYFFVKILFLYNCFKTGPSLIFQPATYPIIQKFNRPGKFFTPLQPSSFFHKVSCNLINPEVDLKWLEIEAPLLTFASYFGNFPVFLPSLFFVPIMSLTLPRSTGYFLDPTWGIFAGRPIYADIIILVLDYLDSSVWVFEKFDGEFSCMIIWQ